MRHTHHRILPAAVLALSFAAATAAAPMAEDAAAPPQPDRNQNVISPVGGYAIMAIFFVAIISVSLLPSKRGAQD